MSNEMTEQEQVLFNEVYLPTFIAKCASLNVPINDQDSLNDALETTALVKQTLQSQESNVIKSAALSLKKALGVATEAPQAKQASYSPSPAVRQAVLQKILEGK